MSGCCLTITFVTSYPSFHLYLSRSMAQTAPIAATLTIEDILADLAVLNGSEGSNSASASGPATQAEQQHPILSLGRSFVPPDSLSRSEIASSSPSAFNRSEKDLLTRLLEDDTTRLKTLLRSLEQGGGKDEEDIGAQLEVVRLFLASSGTTLASLNKSHRTKSSDPAHNGQGIEAGNEIESLHARVARVQADLDQLEKHLEAARRKLD